jgi:hypothetical protein
MMDFLKGISIGLLFLIAVISLGWIVEGNNFILYKFFAPKQEAVRRQVFEQSKAYNQGMIQELQNMQFEYIKASPEHKAALASLILHRAADYNENEMPYDLKVFIHELKGGIK